MTILDDVKSALRVSGTAMDIEITDLISASLLDLKTSGIDADKTLESAMDPLIKRAVITYCKAYFGYDNPDADRLIQSYQMLKNHLSLSSEYRAAVVE
jgi:uncharacterized phage protein (predicted DNA packaging)